METNCLKCGAAIAEGYQFCKECGSPIPEAGICVKCGAQVPKGAQFCAACGSAVGSSPPETTAKPPVAPAAASRVTFSHDWLIVHRKRVIIAAVALLVILIAVFIFFPPTHAVRSGYWEAVADAPKSGNAHILMSDTAKYMLLKSNRHGYVSSIKPTFGEMDMQTYGLHIQYEISGRKITFYSDSNQIEEGTIWGNTIWAFNKKFVKQGN